MKKMLAVFLATCMFVPVMVGCGRTDESPVSTSNTEVTTTPQAATVAPPATTPQSPSKPDSENQTEESTRPSTPPTDAPDEESVFFDEGGIKIAFTGVTYDDSCGPKMEFSIENNSDKNVTLGGEHFVVNGISVLGYLDVSVPSGEKANSTIEFQTIHNLGVTELSTVLCKDSHIIDTDTGETVFNISFDVTVPDTSGSVQDIDETGETIFDQDGITVIARMYNDINYGNSIGLLTKNNSGRDLRIMAKQISVNGTSVDGWLDGVIYADTICFSMLNIDTSTLDEDIEEVRFFIEVTDYDTNELIASSDEVTVLVSE